MTTTELISRISKKAKITRKLAAKVVRSLTAVIQESLKRDEDIRIVGLGTFTAVERKGRRGFDPRTRAKISIPAVKVPRFRAFKALKDAANAGEQEELALGALRDEAQRLCSEGDALSGFHMAMKSLIQARKIFGNADTRTAECMVTVADAAIRRGKYYLAGQMYRKALSIQQKALGPSHPDVVRCETALSDLERDQRL